jgi:predicted RND superfamily exporter protein
LVGVTADEFVIGPDGDYAGIFVFPHVEAGDERFVGAIRDILDQTECSRADCFNLGGPAVFHVALNEASQRYPPHIVLLILFVGGALMWAVTRGLAAAGSAMAAITLSQVVLVGAMSWSRLPMDVSLSMVPPLMMSFGFSYAAHRALRPHIAHLLFLCAANTALGFGTFVSADVPPVRIFAVAGGLGLAVVWLAVVTLVPGPRGRSGVEADHAREPFLVPTAQHILARHSRVVVGAALVVKRQGSTVPK